MFNNYDLLQILKKAQTFEHGPENPTFTMENVIRMIEEDKPQHLLKDLARHEAILSLDPQEPEYVQLENETWTDEEVTYEFSYKGLTATVVLDLKEKMLCTSKIY